MPDQDRQEALDVLDDALQWELAPHRWVEIEQLVAVLAQALTAGDDVTFRQAVYDLELLGPVRAASADNPPSERAGGRVRERINELIRTIARPDPRTPLGSGRGG